MNGFHVLRRAGEAAWGADWRTPMCQALDAYRPGGSTGQRVAERTLYGWEHGAPVRRPPGWAIAAIPALLRDAADALDLEAERIRCLAERGDRSHRVDVLGRDEPDVPSRLAGMARGHFLGLHQDEVEREAAVALATLRRATGK